METIHQERIERLQQNMAAQDVDALLILSAADYAYFIPMPFALHIGREIRRLVSQVPGVERVDVAVNEHLQTEAINAELASQ
jgi:hypothetical protein